MQNDKKKSKQICIWLWIILCSITMIGCGTTTDKKDDKPGSQVENHVDDEVISEEETEEKTEEEENSNIKGGNEDEFKNSKDGIYTDGTITVEIISYDETYEVHVVDGFHDKFYDVKLVDNQLFIERIVTTNMMPEAEDPYDEETHITLSWTEVTEGAFTYPALNYHRDSKIVFQNMDYPENTIETSQDCMLRKNVNTE